MKRFTFAVAVLPTFVFLIWVERNMALPWIGTWIGWPWLDLDAETLTAAGFDALMSGVFTFTVAKIFNRKPRPLAMRLTTLAALFFMPILFMSAWQPTGIILFQSIPSALIASLVSLFLFWGLLALYFYLRKKCEFKPLHLFVGIFFTGLFTPLLSLDRAIITGVAAFVITISHLKTPKH